MSLLDGPSVLFQTDHRLLVLDIKFPQTRRNLKFYLSRSAVCRDEPTRSDYKALQRDTNLQNQLSSYLETRLGSPSEELEDLNEDIVSAVRQGMEEVCPKIIPRRKEEPWKNVELEVMMKKLQKMKNAEGNKNKNR